MGGEWARTRGQSNDVETEEGVGEEGIHAVEDGAFECGHHDAGDGHLDGGVKREHRRTCLTSLRRQRHDKVDRQVSLFTYRQQVEEG